MTNFIPIFPLNLVVYPGENLNLHIFEPRYKQLIQECHTAGKPFGIPAVLENKVRDYGTLVEITELSKVYDNGEMDIKTRGIKVFRILELIREIPDKLYSGAIVNYPPNRAVGNEELMRTVMTNLRELHQHLKVSKDFKKEPEALTSYDVAHHVGLSLTEEYELLGLFDERQRLEYLRLHIARVLSTLAGVEELKDRIKMNGHFKNLSGFNL
ncbi:MAG: LON peptidase substrate-binding domain-containing protein [Bacteroidetes bacterium]|nr:LON peptidase substrate-binding domain-containing protein [Bacteroidota bacterium]